MHRGIIVFRADFCSGCAIRRMLIAIESECPSIARWARQYHGAPKHRFPRSPRGIEGRWYGMRQNKYKRSPSGRYLRDDAAYFESARRVLAADKSVPIMTIAIDTLLSNRPRNFVMPDAHFKSRHRTVARHTHWLHFTEIGRSRCLKMTLIARPSASGRLYPRLSNLPAARNHADTEAAGSMRRIECPVLEPRA